MWMEIYSGGKFMLPLLYLSHNSNPILNLCLDVSVYALTSDCNNKLLASQVPDAELQIDRDRQKLSREK
jgi:hypothetical protein